MQFVPIFFIYSRNLEHIRVMAAPSWYITRNCLSLHFSAWIVACMLCPVINIDQCFRLVFPALPVCFAALLVGFVSLPVGFAALPVGLSVIPVGPRLFRLVPRIFRLFSRLFRLASQLYFKCEILHISITGVDDNNYYI